jgi:hypothetical protein
MLLAATGRVMSGNCNIIRAVLWRASAQTLGFLADERWIPVRESLVFDPAIFFEGYRAVAL